MIEKNVSVIVPTYNRAHVLFKTIKSYIQDVTKEVIIVDDGSNDHTRMVVSQLHRKYYQIKYIKLKKHMGLPYAKNVGVNRSSGKYIFFGDDDAWLYDGTLFRLRNALEKFPADIAGANGSYAETMNQIQHIDEYIKKHFTRDFKDNCIVDFNTGKFNYDFKIERVVEGLFTMSCFMIPKELAVDVKFDTGYIGNAAREDIDYLVQQAKYGRRMVYVPNTYEIDLPRSVVNGGGSHSYGLLKIIYFTIRNHSYFLDKHYEYLKKEEFITVSRAKVMMSLIMSMISDVFESWKSAIARKYTREIGGNEK